MLQPQSGGSKLVKFFTSFDYIQIAAMAVLLAVGVIFIYSTGVQIGTPASEGYYLRQLQWITIGLCFYVSLALVDFRKLMIPSVLFYPVCIVLLIAVFLVGTKVWGAQRWLSIPGINIRLQPSEFTKLALIFVLAGLFSSRMFTIAPEEMAFRGKRASQWITILIAAGLIGLPFLLIMKEPDLGSALVLPPIGAAIVFIAGIRRKFLAWILTLLLAVFLLLAGNEFWPHREVNRNTGAVTLTYPGIRPFLRPYQRERLLTFFDPERDLHRFGYNRHQALLAVGSGGLTGKGIGKGTQNLLGFLPQSVSNNDFIFAVIAEETGFFGCMVLFGAYIMLFYSILRTALTTDSCYGRYFAVGVATMLFVHIFINTGMSIGVTPVTGLSLPLVSYGGSFMITVLAALGVMQSIYRFRSTEE
ncbi:MAG: rod shape-determining protein RodA [Lentisphaeria bacterium]|nr:rod shape-determining protein RodA [Lentisphaeria bacterium]MBQ7392993.1 rod shape-determining protein RodA [Lentisphaeria bacterium]